VRSAEGFRLIALSCLRQVTANTARVREQDAEALHQLRVGLRRLRASFSLFRKMLKGPETTKLQAELRWCAAQLGPARDYDVFADDLQALRESDATHSAPLARLEALLSESRARAFARACQSIDSERFQRALEHTASWLLAGEWTKLPEKRRRKRRDRRLWRFARKELERRLAKLLARLSELPRLDAHGRHQLRIAVKKLRYGAEFFASLFKATDEAQRRLIKCLKDLQAALGRLNDMSVQERLATELLAGSGLHGASSDPALALMTAREAADADALLRSAAEASASLQACPPFWR
jgi:triphosphatase